MNKSMALKRQEDKFYTQLEHQIQVLKSYDKELIRKPSRDEIVKHLGVKTRQTTK